MIRVKGPFTSAATACAALSFAAVALTASAVRAEPVVPDDTPWTVDDASPGSRPSTIEELLSRDLNADQDIAPPTQDQPDYAAPADAVSGDRLAPKLPAQIDQARVPQPETVRPSAPPSIFAHPDLPAPTRGAATMPSATPAPSARAQTGLEAVKPAVTPSAVATPVPGAAPRPDAAAANPNAATGLNTPGLAPTEISRPAPAAAPPVAGTAPPPAPAAAMARTAPAMAPAAQPSATSMLTTPSTSAPVVGEHDPSAPPPVAVPAEPVTQASIGINGKLYLPLKRYFESKSETVLARFAATDRAALAAHYDKTVGEALWVSKDGFTPAAQALIAELRKADEWGLASADYAIPDLMAKGGEYSFEDLADAEIKLSLTAMEYVRHARGDRIDTPAEQLSSYIDRRPQLIEPAKVIDGLIAASDKGAYLRSLHPKHPQFDLLRLKLAELRAQQRDGTEPDRLAPGPKVNPGKTHGDVALVRQRLAVPVPQDKANAPGAETVLDEALARAIMDYKKKNGIEPVNGAITDALRTSLNRAAIIDENKLLANMEQWRWMPEDLGKTFVWVNIPEFLVRVMKGEEVIHEERVVTGRNETQTPIFSDKMERVVFQPSWNVPESIKVNELLPKLRAGGNPIEGQGLKIEKNGREVSAWDIDWGRQDIRNLHIYQPPGESNVLGVVKFLFPNKHSVYLHDTPSKRLFNEKIRTFSHGCMRVRNPVRLAEVIMGEDKGWDKEKVDDLVISGPPNNDISLDHPIPVHVTYFTMWVSDDGSVRNFPDVYGHEKRIILGLNGRWEEIEKNPDHLAPADPSAVVARDDWGDQDDDPSARQVRRRLSYDQQGARAGYRPLPPPPRTRQGVATSQKSTLGDIISNIFGQN